MRTVILLASVSFASGVLFVNIYNSLVDAVAIASDIPNSVIAARELYNTANPGTFFRIFAPLTQLLALLSLILFWKKSSAIRLALGIAFACYVAADVLTFLYFYPRNEILFFSEPLPDIEILRTASSEWATMNWIRSLIALCGVIASFIAVHKIYSLKQHVE